MFAGSSASLGNALQVSFGLPLKLLNYLQKERTVPNFSSLQLAVMCTRKNLTQIIGQKVEKL